MRALTVWQPWASLIAHGWKPYEFRGWRAPAAFVGERIAIHAGARKPRESEIWEVRCDIEEPGPWGISMDARQFLWETGRHEYSLGAIVATAVLGEPISPAKVASASGFSETRDGQFNWLGR